MKPSGLFLLINIFCISIFATQISITEADLPQLILKKNSLVQAGKSNIIGLKAGSGHLARSFVPEISLMAGQETFRRITKDFKKQPYFGAELKLNLYNGGRDHLKNKMNKLSLAKGESQQKVTIFSLLEKARKSYWKALYFKKLITLYDKALELIGKNKKAALRRIRGGVATKSDKFEFNIKEVELKQDKKRALLNLEKKMSYLKILLSLKQEQELILNQSLTHDHNWKSLLKHSEDDHNYLIQPQELEIKKNNLNSKLVRRNWYPKLDAHALWLQNNQREDFALTSKSQREQTAFGLTATWKLSKLVTGNPEAKIALATQKANEHRLNFKKRELESELHLELKELELLDSMVHDAEENIKRSNRFFKLITSEYNRGIKSSGDMLMATEKLITSEMRMIEIIKDFHMARAHIMAKLGR